MAKQTVRKIPHLDRSGSMMDVIGRNEDFNPSETFLVTEKLEV